jgi:hypothetical protein
MFMHQNQLWGGCVLPVFITVFQFEQWAYIRFFCKQRKSGVVNPVGLTAEAVYGDKALKHSTVYNWFKNGHKSL